MRIHGLLACGGLFGCIAVAFGAYAEHGLRPTLAEADYHSLSIALHYLLLHAAVVLAIALAGMHSARLRVAGWAFTAGMALFSGSIGLAVLTGNAALKAAAPMGGTLLMLGWLAAASAAFTPRR